MPFYHDAKRSMWISGLNMEDADVYVQLVTAGYVPDYAADIFLDDISAGYRVGAPQLLTGKTFAEGVFDADDVLFPALSGSTATAYVIYIDGPTEGESRLVLYNNSATNLPYTPSGADANLVWSTGGYKIAAIIG